jgi:hypothetical protein
LVLLALILLAGRSAHSPTSLVLLALILLAGRSACPPTWPVLLALILLAGRSAHPPTSLVLLGRWIPGLSPLIPLRLALTRGLPCRRRVGGRGFLLPALALLLRGLLRSFFLFLLFFLGFLRGQGHKARKYQHDYCRT